MRAFILFSLPGPFRSSSFLVLPITSNLSANSFLCCMDFIWGNSHDGLLKGSKTYISPRFPFSFFAQSYADCERESWGLGEVASDNVNF